MRMKPHHRLTIVRNRYRARDLRMFRARVDAYFEQLLDDGVDLPPDPEAVRAARAQINRMLPRVMQVVEAAELDPSARSAETLHDIFSAQDAEGRHQAVLDVLDMAIGVYDAGQLAAVARTFNPFYYLLSALAFLAGLPRRALVAGGLMRPPEARVRPDRPRLTGVEQVIKNRLGEMRDWQSRVFSENASQLTDLAERLDFLERVLAQQRPGPQLNPGERKAVTPH